MKTIIVETRSKTFKGMAKAVNYYLKHDNIVVQEKLFESMWRYNKVNTQSVDKFMYDAYGVAHGRYPVPLRIWTIKLKSVIKFIIQF